MKKVLVVVDMQNDFIDGSLGTKEAQVIVPNVVDLIKEWDGQIICTYDTHYDNYSNTLEGKMLPVEHCQVNTKGWEYPLELTDALYGKSVVNYPKITFGSEDLMNSPLIEEGDEIIIVGLCTDICVISNALLLRAKYPNNKITCIADCCAGVTPAKHEAALEVMRSCQIEVI